MDRHREREPTTSPTDQGRAERAEGVAAAPSDRLSAQQLVALQRSAGNQAVRRMLDTDAAGLGAKQQPEDPEQIEDLGGNGDGDGATATTTTTDGGSDSGGAPVSVGTANVNAPTWSPHGVFQWDVTFNTTGTSGWIVQEITATRSGTVSGGGAVAAPTTPHYWEAWAVNASSAVTPLVGGINDMWSRRSFGAGSKGKWTMGGNVFFTKTDPATQSFTAGGVPEAGILLSTTSAPSGLGAVKLTRAANGTWDSTGATPTHAGAAGP